MSNIGYLSTSGSCVEAYIKRGETSFLLIKLSDRANAIAIIQNIGIEIIRDNKKNKPLIKEGISTLLIANGGAFVGNALESIPANKNFLKIPLPVEIPKEKYPWQNKLILYYLSGGRKISAPALQIKEMRNDEE